MTNRDLGRLAAFLVGLFWAPGTISSVYYILMHREQILSPEHDRAGWVWVYPMAAMVLAVSLVVVPGWWACLVFRKESALSFTVEGAREAQEFLVFLAGAVLLALAAPEVIGMVFDWFEATRHEPMVGSRGVFGREQPPTVGENVALGVRLLAGLFLVFCNSRVVAFWQRTRES